MRQVEAVASLQFVRDRLQDLERNFGLGSAAAAHHVVVQRGVGTFVLRHAVVKVGVADDPKLFEHFERAIHGGDVDVRKSPHDLLMHRLGGEVAMGPDHDVQDQLALGRHAQAASPERDFQVGGLEQTISRSAPYHSAMSTSPGDDSDGAPASAPASGHGEILKASEPGAEQVQVGMEVACLDGERVGTVKEIRGTEFHLSRHMAHDLWVPFSAVLAAEDYTANYRGPVQPTTIVLNISGAHLDRQGWRHA